MKNCFLALLVTLAAFNLSARSEPSGPAPIMPQRVAEIVLESDRVEVSYHDANSKTFESFTVADRDLIERFATALGDGSSSRIDRLFCMGQPITIYDMNGKKLLGLRVSEPLAPDSTLPQRVAKIVLESDHVELSNYVPGSRGFETFTVSDRDWIETFAKILSEVTYRRSGHLLAIGPPITFCDKNGRELLKLEVFEASLRVNSLDYVTGQEACAALKTLREEKWTEFASAGSEQEQGG